MTKFSVSEDGEGPSRSRPTVRRTILRSESEEDDREEGEEEEELEEQSDEYEGEREEEEEGLDEEEEYSNEEEGGEEIEQEEREQNEEQPPEPQRNQALIFRSSRRNVDGSDRLVSNKDSTTVILTDPEVLDCSICCEPLSIPIFQCENGHIACSSCCTKIKNKCPSCSLPIGYSRCRAIEKVLESAKVSCQYSKYGCKKRVNYGKKIDHEKTCMYAPCLCPISDCPFISSSKQLSLHFSSKHSNSSTKFRYNTMFSISLKPNDKFQILQDKSDGVLFILSNYIGNLGNLVMINCIGPTASKERFCYDLRAKTQETAFIFQSGTNNIQGRVENPPLKGFVLIPREFFELLGQMKLDVNIWRSGLAASYAQGIIGV